MNYSHPQSRIRDVQQISRDKLDCFPRATTDLRFASLIDMGFATIGPLARRSRLRSGSCTLARVFASTLLQTPPRSDALALRYHFTSISCEEDLHLQAVEHARRTNHEGRTTRSGLLKTGR